MTCSGGLLLGYACVPEEAIGHAFDILFDCVNRHLRQRRATAA